MASDYMDWCLAHGFAGQLLLIATAFGVIYLCAAIWALLFWRD